MEKKKKSMFCDIVRTYAVCVSKFWVGNDLFIFLEQEKYNCTLKTVFETIYVKNKPPWLQKELNFYLL